MKTNKINQGGQSTIEFTIVALFFVLLLVGVLYVYSDLQLSLWVKHQSYELALCAAYHDTAKCKAKTKDNLKPLLPKSSKLEIQTQGNLRTKKGLIRYEGLLRKILYSESEFRK